jgi:hypothetical protein
MRSAILPSNTGAKPWDSRAAFLCGLCKATMVTELWPYSRNHGRWSSGGRRKLCRRRRGGLRGCWYSTSRTRRTEYARLHLGRTPAGGAQRLRHPHRPEVYHNHIVIYSLTHSHHRLDQGFASVLCPLCLVNVVMLDKLRTISWSGLDRSIDRLAFGFGLTGSVDWHMDGLHTLPSRIFVCNRIFTLIRTLKLKVTRFSPSRCMACFLNCGIRLVRRS